jgi:hypothetical protein
MKTAEEWSNILNEIGPDELTIDTVQEIQLDAFKAGAEWAAARVDDVATKLLQIAKDVQDDDRLKLSLLNDCNEWTLARQAILTAAANLKEIPK